MNKLLAVLLVTGLIAAGPAYGQETPALETESPMPPALPPESAPADVSGRTAELQANVDRLESRIKRLEEQLAATRDTIAALETANETQQALMARLATQDESGGHTLDVLGNMSNSSQFRRQLRQAVQGKLRFLNNTGEEQVLYVNGSPWLVRLEDSYIHVPLGTVSIRQRGEERPIFLNDWQFDETAQESFLVYNFEPPATTVRQRTARRSR